MLLRAGAGSQVTASERHSKYQPLTLSGFCFLGNMMEPNKTTMTAGGTIATHPHQVCDGDCQKGPQSPAQNLGASPQPIEKEQLTAPQITNRHFWKSPSQPASLGGAYCKNDPPDAPPDFDLPPQPTETKEVTTP